MKRIFSAIIAIAMMTTMATATVTSAAETTTVVHPVTDYDINGDGTINVLDLCRIKAAVLEANGFNAADLMRATFHLLGLQVEDPQPVSDEFTTNIFEDFSDEDVLKLGNFFNDFSVDFVDERMIFKSYLQDGSSRTFSAAKQYKCPEDVTSAEILAICEKEGKAYVFYKDAEGKQKAFWTEINNVLVCLPKTLTINLSVYQSDYGRDGEKIFTEILGEEEPKYLEQTIEGNKVTTKVQYYEYTITYILETSKEEIPEGIYSLVKIYNINELIDYVVFTYDRKIVVKEIAVSE